MACGTPAKLVAMQARLACAWLKPTCNAWEGDEQERSREREGERGWERGWESSRRSATGAPQAQVLRNSWKCS